MDLDKPLGKVNKHYFASRYNESFPRNLPLFKEYLKTGQTGNVLSHPANELDGKRVEERGTFVFSLICDYFGCLIFEVFFLMSALMTG